MASVLHTLDDLWRKGRLSDVEKDLDAFIRQHLPEIRKALREEKSAGLEVARKRHSRGEISDRQLVDFSVRAVLRRKGTCNARRDIQDQIGEIEKEVWYEGERSRTPITPARREEIARSWAKRHASMWREWRLYQLLFLWDKKLDDYVPLIAERQPQ
jgi:hypothetical protein